MKPKTINKSIHKRYRRVTYGNMTIFYMDIFIKNVWRWLDWYNENISNNTENGVALQIIPKATTTESLK